MGAIAVVRRERKSLDLIDSFVAFGAGFMLSVAMLDMLPHALSIGDHPAYYVFGGYLAVHLAQHVFVPHFHYGEETHRVSRGSGITALVGLSLHTFFDGVAIASGFLVSGELGLLLFLAVLLHKLPEGVTIASVMLAGGQNRGRALGAAAALGLATVVGVVATGHASGLAKHGLAVSAGVTIYVAASDLVPTFQARRGWRMPLAFFGGAAAYLVTRMLLEGVGLT
ncbi:MAG: ZIP family metal transporter [Gemmatimonadota bacterium]